MFRTIERYEEDALGLPYAVTLSNIAEEEIDPDTGERIGVSVPDLEQLVAALAIGRAVYPLQLDGSEVKFIRRAIGLSAKEFATRLDLDPATLSRWENGKQCVGEWADRQVRYAAVIMLRDRVRTNADESAVVGLRIIPRQPDQWPIIEVVHEASGVYDIIPLKEAA